MPIKVFERLTGSPGGPLVESHSPNITKKAEVQAKCREERRDSTVRLKYYDMMLHYFIYCTFFSLFQLGGQDARPLPLQRQTRGNGNSEILDSRKELRKNPCFCLLVDLFW